MDYIHIKNLDKYHAGYKDRSLIWAKIYFSMVHGDPDWELIDNEIDKWRFVCLVCLELKAKKPIPLDSRYLAKNGFDLKKRPISKTLLMLHNFLDCVSDNNASTKSASPRVEKSRVEKTSVTQLSDEEFLTSLKENAAYKGIDIDGELGKMDAWLSLNPNRKKTRRFILNWLNKVDKPLKGNYEKRVRSRTDL